MPTSTNLEQLKLAIEEEKTVIYPVNIRSLIESKKVGILIGKRGLTIQHIQNNCGAHMFFYGEHANTCFRLLHIDGPPRCCTKALSHSFQRLIQGELRLGPINDKIGVDLVLPNEFIEFLQSMGQFIRIARESNTEITVKSQFLPRSTERVVRVTIPDLDQLYRFDKAMELLVNLLQKHRGLALSAGTSFYVPVEGDSEALSNICNIPNKHDQIYHL